MLLLRMMQSTAPLQLVFKSCPLSWLIWFSQMGWVQYDLLSLIGWGALMQSVNSSCSLIFDTISLGQLSSPGSDPMGWVTQPNSTHTQSTYPLFLAPSLLASLRLPSLIWDGLSSVGGGMLAHPHTPPLLVICLLVKSFFHLTFQLHNNSPIFCLLIYPSIPWFPSPPMILWP